MCEDIMDMVDREADNSDSLEVWIYMYIIIKDIELKNIGLYRVSCFSILLQVVPDLV